MLQTRAAIAEAPWPANSAIVLLGSVGGQRPERGIFRRDADRENRAIEKGKDQRIDRQAERQRQSRNLAGDKIGRRIEIEALRNGGRHVVSLVPDERPRRG